ncbi:MAG: GMC family oxidoreductase [Polyangiaceae bacterium]|nr:GMC family oxidoreductase [Polyangiaceae bacterium]
MTGGVLDASASTMPARVDCQVCVIGSGCAGATAAWELAAAGRDVVVLEEGGDYVGEALSMRDGMHDLLYWDRGGRATDDLSISLLHGRALGGGGVINASDVVPIPDGVLRCWQRRWGLTELSPEALAPYRARALEDLSANLPPALNENNRILERGARALGWRGEVMLHNRRGCIGLGKCLVGCRVGAKRNPRAVAIPAAVEAGARFFTRARALRIEGATAPRKIVRVRTLDERGYHERGESEIRAETVIVASSALGSAELLLRSGLGNRHVGRNVSLQPQLPVTASFAHEVRSFTGIPQSYAVTEFETLEDAEHGWWGFRVEPVAGTPGITASMLPTLGHPGKELMTRYPRMAAALALVPDGGHGVLTVRRGRAFVEYRMPDEQKQRYRDAAKAAARLWLAAGAEEVMVPTARPVVVRREADLAEIDRLDFSPATTPFVSAHQQGSVRMAPSERDGATAPSGRLWGTRGIYVFDSAVFPTSASSHIMAPILTVSRWLARRLLAEGA